MQHGETRSGEWRQWGRGPRPRDRRDSWLVFAKAPRCARQRLTPLTCADGYTGAMFCEAVQLTLRATQQRAGRWRWHCFFDVMGYELVKASCGAACQFWEVPHPQESKAAGVNHVHQERPIEIHCEQRSILLVSQWRKNCMWLLPGGYSPEHLCQLGHAMRNEADGLDVRQVLSLSAEQLERRGSRISRIPIRRTPRRTRRTFIFGTALSPVQRLLD